jgi:hypothetical protein
MLEFENVLPKEFQLENIEIKPGYTSQSYLYHISFKDGTERKHKDVTVIIKHFNNVVVEVTLVHSPLAKTTLSGLEIQAILDALQQMRIKGLKW